MQHYLEDVIESIKSYFERYSIIILIALGIPALINVIFSMLAGMR
ncbi:hypothetical protein [Bacillus safensis]